MFQPHFSQTISNRLDELTLQACPGIPNPGLLVGLSGGPDSVALLLTAKIWANKQNRPLAAAHLNHRLRGNEADTDAVFCAELCTNLGIAFHLREEDPRPLARKRGTGIEDAARILRHDFFASLLTAHPDLHCVATGHHRDDQAETVVMRLFRGTGPDGMAGIRPVSGSIIHPLLHLKRSEIMAWLEAQNQPWRTDATNLDGDNTRSRLRRELFPLLRSIFGEGAALTPARLADLWENDLNFLESLTRQSLSELTAGQARTTNLPIKEWLALEPGLDLRVLRLWLREQKVIDPSRLEAVHLMNIHTWLREGTSGSTLDLPGGVQLHRDFNTLCFLAPDGFETPMREASGFRILVSRIDSPAEPESWGRNEGNGLRTEDGTWNLTCPSAVLKGNLKVRNWCPGDRLHPFGLDGTRKLSDLFREQQIATTDRANVLVVEDEEGILWVVGLARAERTRLYQPDAATVSIAVAPRGH